MATGGTADAGARASILAWRRDHGKLELQLAAVRKALEKEERLEAKRLFGDLRATLSEHLRIEEELAFPEVQKLIPAGADPVRSLRLAHQSYRRDLGEIERGHLEAATATFSAFLESFTTHERLEDQLLDLLR